MEILQTIFAHDNVTVQHQVMPYRRSLSALSTGRADCFLGAVQSAHLGIAPKVPIALFDLSAAHLRRGPMQWQSPASLTDKNVAHVRGFNFKSIVGIEFNPVEVDRLELALRMLRLGRVDFVLDDDQLIAEAMRTENMARDSLSVHTFQQVPVFPIFAATERGERFARIYDKGIRRVIENGEMAKILKRWGLPHDNVRELLSP